MASIEVENFQTSYKKIMAEWVKAVEPRLKEIKEITEELDKLDAQKGKLSDEDKKRYKKLSAQREKCQKAVDAANFELKENLLNIAPPKKAPKEEINELLKWMKDTFEKIKKGLPLGRGFTLQPDAEFNWKKLEFESLGVNLKWEF